MFSRRHVTVSKVASKKKNDTSDKDNKDSADFISPRDIAIRLAASDNFNSLKGVMKNAEIKKLQIMKRILRKTYGQIRLIQICW